MGQGMTREAAAFEAARLLDMAVKLLDDSGNYVAAANVARAIDLLADAGVDRGSVIGLPTDMVAFSPSWGDLVDRESYAG